MKTNALPTPVAWPCLGSFCLRGWFVQLLVGGAPALSRRPPGSAPKRPCVLHRWCFTGAPLVVGCGAPQPSFVHGTDLPRNFSGHTETGQDGVPLFGLQVSSALNEVGESTGELKHSNANGSDEPFGGTLEPPPQEATSQMLAKSRSALAPDAPEVATEISK